ncbi:MAG: AI-2E family transporter [bacterium]
MIDFLKEWYNRHFSNPQVALLAVILILGFTVILLAGKILAPLLAAIVIAYLLDGGVDWLVRWRIPRLVAVTVIFLVFMTSVMGVMFWLVPLLFKQMTQFFSEVPSMAAKGQQLLMQLPERYPTAVSEADIASIIGQIRSELGGVGQKVLSLSVSSMMNIFTALVYLVLVPVLVFFLLKDKHAILKWASSFLPEDRSLSLMVWREMNQKIASYARGKLLEIIIVWAAAYLVFAYFDLHYAMLLALIVGLSVIIPYVGAAAATLPVALIAYFQWGLHSPFLYVILAYGVLQFIDGNILVPLLFSEVVNLHPVAIIAAVLTFGGTWGIWGVFFAIPLATLIQAVINAWPSPKKTIYDENEGKHPLQQG